MDVLTHARDLPARHGRLFDPPLGQTACVIAPTRPRAAQPASRRSRILDSPHAPQTIAPPAWAPPPSRPRVRATTTRRGRMFSPVWPQQIVPAGPWYLVVPVSRPRPRAALQRRGRIIVPPPQQPSLVTSAPSRRRATTPARRPSLRPDPPWTTPWVPPPSRPRIRVAAVRHGRTFDLVWPQQIVSGGPWYWVAATSRPRIKPELLRRGRRSDVLGTGQAPLQSTAIRRVRATPTSRKRRADPPWTTAMVAAPTWVPALARIRVRLGVVRRGKRSDPSWIAQQQPAPKWPPAITRARPRVALVRRGHRSDPYFWGLPPRVCEPTTATITRYTSSVAAPYVSGAAIVRYGSTSPIIAYASAGAVVTYASHGAITGYASTEALVTYSSAAAMSACSGP